MRLNTTKMMQGAAATAPEGATAAECLTMKLGDAQDCARELEGDFEKLGGRTVLGGNRNAVDVGLGILAETNEAAVMIDTMRQAPAVAKRAGRDPDELWQSCQSAVGAQGAEEAAGEFADGALRAQEVFGEAVQCAMEAVQQALETQSKGAPEGERAGYEADLAKLRALLGADQQERSAASKDGIRQTRKLRQEVGHKEEAAAHFLTLADAHDGVEVDPAALLAAWRFQKEAQRKERLAAYQAVTEKAPTARSG